MFLRSLLFGLVLFFTQAVSALTLDVYYSPTCPHCHHALNFIDSTLIKEFPDLDVKKHNVFVSTEGEKMKSEVNRLGLRGLGVPLLVIGDDAIHGFGSADTTGEELRQMVKDYISGNVKKKDNAQESKRFIKAGLFGEVDLIETSLPALAIVLGLVDGFNPCAMWVLVFMIGLILEIKDRKKIWTIVGTFIVASGILYFLFMTIWFNAFQIMGHVVWVQRLLGLGALYLAFVSLRDFWRGKVECEVGDLESKKKTRKKIQNIINSPMSIALFISIIGLAFTVNAIEFACSLGLPAIFTGVLAQANLSPLGYYGYIGLYDFFYMFDDIVIFSLAALTIDKFVGDKYVKYCKLIGGIILLLLSVLLIVAPEMLR